MDEASPTAGFVALGEMDGLIEDAREHDSATARGCRLIFMEAGIARLRDLHGSRHRTVAGSSWKQASHGCGIFMEAGIARLRGE
jgi:hypothetical protein